MFTDTSSKDLSADLGSGCDWYNVNKITTMLATTTMKGQTTVCLQEHALGDACSSPGPPMLSA